MQTEREGGVEEKYQEGVHEGNDGVEALSGSNGGVDWCTRWLGVDRTAKMTILIPADCRGMST